MTRKEAAELLTRRWSCEGSLWAEAVGMAISALNPWNLLGEKKPKKAASYWTYCPRWDYPTCYDRSIWTGERFLNGKGITHWA